MAYDDAIKREARKRGLKGASMVGRMNDAAIAQMHGISGGLLYPKQGPKATERALNRGDLKGPNSPHQPNFATRALDRVNFSGVDQAKKLAKATIRGFQDKKPGFSTQTTFNKARSFGQKVKKTMGKYGVIIGSESEIREAIDHQKLMNQLIKKKKSDF